MEVQISFTNAFANSSELSNKIYLNHAVTSITQNSDNVIVNAGGNQFQADRVLCTVPLTVLNKINFSPALSSEKQTAMNGGFRYARQLEYIFSLIIDFGRMSH